MWDQAEPSQVALATRPLNRRGQYVAVFLDEAEELDTYMLDLVRALLNYEKSDTGKLIQFVIAGAIELHDRLARKRNRALRSRVLYIELPRAVLPRTRR